MGVSFGWTGVDITGDFCNHPPFGGGACSQDSQPNDLPLSPVALVPKPKSISAKSVKKYVSVGSLTNPGYLAANALRRFSSTCVKIGKPLTYGFPLKEGHASKDEHPHVPCPRPALSLPPKNGGPPKKKKKRSRFLLVPS